ncbi:hypothetical protein ACHAWU_006167 [Discostella pseudostelligera]|uniref:Uncharacterized protein n=1 Tax=Discostella pseudostelligera TaxID=259834 RepID=A0ABD3M8G7_9STRA
MESTSLSLQQRQWGNNNNHINNHSSLSSSASISAAARNHQNHVQLLQPSYTQSNSNPRRLGWASLFLTSLISWGSAIEVTRFRHEQAMRREYYASLSSGTSNNNNNIESNSNNGVVAQPQSAYSHGNIDITTSYDTETSADIAKIAIFSITSIFLLTFVYLAIQILIPQQQLGNNSLTPGTKIEFTLLLLLIGLSCTAVSTTTNPIYGLAINPISGEVAFGNLYYSIWASWICILTLVLSYIRTKYGIDVLMEMKSRGGKRLRLWIGLIIVNLLVMASSATCYDAKCGNYEEDDASDGTASNQIYYDNNLQQLNDPWEESRSKKYCHRAAFGVSVGCIGCVTSLSVVAMRSACTPSGTIGGATTSSSNPQENIGGGGGDGDSKSKKIIFVVECLSSWTLLVMNCFAVAYLTSEGGPGAPIGNLFFATWITFVMVIFVAVSCFGEVQLAKKIYQHRYTRQDSSTENTMSEEGMEMDNISSLNLSSYDRRSTGGLSSSRFDDYDSEDAPSMFVRSMCSGSVVEVQVGD